MLPGCAGMSGSVSVSDINLALGYIPGYYSGWPSFFPVLLGYSGVSHVTLTSEYGNIRVMH